VFHKVVWQHARHDGIFNKYFTANLSRNIPAKKYI